MNAEALRAPFAAVDVKRMFGGYGVYADKLCFVIEAAAKRF